MYGELRSVKRVERRSLERRYQTMARDLHDRRSSWIAFAAGAVAMLALALLVWVWRARDDGAALARTAAAATAVLPDVARPTLPDAPRLPDAPIPVPK